MYLKQDTFLHTLANYTHNAGNKPGFSTELGVKFDIETIFCLFASHRLTPHK